MMERDPDRIVEHAGGPCRLPTPVPIYVTYLTAQAHGGQLSFVDDITGATRGVQIAALR